MVTNLILTALTSGAFFTFLQFLISRHDKKKGKAAELMNAQLAWLQAVIVDRCQKALDRGSITFDDKDEIYEIYTPYRKAGGNHKAKERWEEVEKLPVVQEYEER